MLKELRIYRPHLQTNCNEPLVLRQLFICGLGGRFGMGREKIIFALPPADRDRYLTFGMSRQSMVMPECA